LVAEGIKVLQENKIASTTFPEPAATALAKFAKFSEWSKEKNEELLSYKDVDRSKVAAIFAEAKSKGQTSFPEAEAMEIMRAYKFPLLKSAVAKNAQEALKIMQEFNCAVAMKIVSADILHKSDVGGVSLAVTSETIISEYKAMMERVAKNKPKAKLEGVLLMEMAKKGTELILGINKNSLGTMLMFGLGGIYVEIFKDVKFAFAPLTRTDTLNMIKSLHCSQLLEGARGEKAVDKEKIIEAIGRLSQLVNDFPEIVELDINPLLVNAEGAKVLDARVVIE
jgi:acyl-CoA synthetase (NDP forming)